MAGEPKPCVMREKCVRWRWMPGSRIGCGRVFPSGERSWFSRSVISFSIVLQRRKGVVSDSTKVSVRSVDSRLHLSWVRCWCEYHIRRVEKCDPGFQIFGGQWDIDKCCRVLVQSLVQPKIATGTTGVCAMSKATASEDTRATKVAIAPEKEKLSYLVARIIFFLWCCSEGSLCCRAMYSAVCRAGNSVSHR